MNEFFKGRSAVITGASSGIGQAVVKKFLELSVSVTVHCNSRKLRDCKSVKAFQADFSNSCEIEKFADFAVKNNEKIDFLVNCCGVSENKPFNELAIEDLIRIYNVNVFSHFVIMQKIFPLMISRKFGRIVSMSSIGVKYAGSGTSMIYSSSKASLEALSRSFAKQGASANVLVNSIRAGLTDTDFHRKSGKDMKKRTELVPLGRMAAPEEIAEMVIYLCSEKASFITGQEFAVSGGE